MHKKIFYSLMIVFVASQLAQASDFTGFFGFASASTSSASSIVGKAKNVDASEEEKIQKQLESLRETQQQLEQEVGRLHAVKESIDDNIESGRKTLSLQAQLIAQQPKIVSKKKKARKADHKSKQQRSAGFSAPITQTNYSSEFLPLNQQNNAELVIAQQEVSAHLEHQKRWNRELLYQNSLLQQELNILKGESYLGAVERKMDKKTEENMIAKDMLHRAILAELAKRQERRRESLEKERSIASSSSSSAS
jgi:hypothetical protein